MNLLAGRTLLVVDDEPVIRDLLRDELEAAGAKVLVAEGGREAAWLIRSGDSQIDGILTDVRMPGGDGFELLALVRQSFGDRMPVFIMTAYADAEIEGQAQRGSCRVFPKPFDLEALLGEIAEAMGRKAV